MIIQGNGLHFKHKPAILLKRKKKKKIKIQAILTINLSTKNGLRGKYLQLFYKQFKKLNI